MKIDVTRLLKNVGNELDVEETETFNFADDNLALVSPVTVKAHLINTGRTILLKGSMGTKVRLACCRCLKEFDLPLDIEIEEEYSKRIVTERRSPAKNDVQLNEEDFIFPVSEDNKIDMTEAIRQNIMTSLPIKPLCNEACRGLAAVKKIERLPDPRLLKLKEIKGKIRNG